mgnify:CR=1 FL=1
MYKNDTKKTVKSSTFAKSSKKKKSSTIASSEILKKDLHKTYLSGNRYLSAYEDENEVYLLTKNTGKIYYKKGFDYNNNVYYTDNID